MAQPNARPNAQPNVNVTRHQGGYNVTGTVHLPAGCTKDEVFRVFTDFDNYNAWNPGVKRCLPSQAEPDQEGVTLPGVRMVQSVGFANFRKDFDTFLQANPQPSQHALSLKLVKSDLYHQYSSCIQVEDTPEGSGPLLVKFSGHYGMKFGPPPPLGRVFMPRTLRSSVTEMLSKLQEEAARATIGAPMPGCLGPERG